MSNYKIGTNGVIIDIDTIIKSGTDATAPSYVGFPTGAWSTLNSNIEVQTTRGKFNQDYTDWDVLEINRYTKTRKISSYD